MSTLTSLVDEKASQIAAQVGGITQETAGTLHATASSVRERGKQGSQAIKDIAGNTAEALDQAGYYVEAHDAQHTLAQSRHILRKYPVESIVLAAGVGFLSGITFLSMIHTCNKPQSK